MSLLTLFLTVRAEHNPFMKSANNRLLGRNEIVSNAARLFKNAKLLVDNERYASAFALSVLALEEIGKVVLDLWDASQSVPKSGKRPSSHLRKQAAVSSLLLAQYTQKNWVIWSAAGR